MRTLAGPPSVASASLMSAAALLAVSSVLTKALLDGAVLGFLPPIGPLTLLVLQLGGSLVMLTLGCVWTGAGFVVAGHGRRLAAAGALLGSGSICTVMALSSMPVGEAAVVFSVQPVVIIVLAWCTLGEVMAMRAVLLSIAAVGGVVLVVVGGGGEVSPTRPVGIVFALLSAVAAAGYVVVMRRVSAFVRPMTALVRVQLVALAMAMAGWCGATLLGAGESRAPSLAVASAAAGIGVAYYGLAFVVYLVGLARTEAGRAGAYLNLVPVFTIGLSAAVLGEQLTRLQSVGSLIVLAAVVALGSRSAVRTPTAHRLGSAARQPNAE